MYQLVTNEKIINYEFYINNFFLISIYNQVKILY